MTQSPAAFLACFSDVDIVSNYHIPEKSLNLKCDMSGGGLGGGARLISISIIANPTDSSSIFTFPSVRPSVVRHIGDMSIYANIYRF